MPLAKDRCLCLRKHEYSETSQILTLFARELGIFRAIAKGAHRRTKAGAGKFDGGIDLLDLGAAVFTHDPARELAILTEWSLRDGHLDIRRSLRAVYLATYAAELVTRLVEEHDAHPALFDRLEAVLKNLPGPRREEEFLAFELDLLRQTGYLPQLFRCGRCGQTPSDREAVFFSPARGSILCQNCEGLDADRRPLDVRLLRLLQSLLRMANGVRRLPQLTRRQTDPINRLLADHIQHTLGRGLQLANYVLG